MKIAFSIGGNTFIEDFDEDKHKWVNNRTSPLGDKLKLCSIHSKCKEIIIKEAENWDEDPVLEYKTNYDNPSKWAIWFDKDNCYDVCHLKHDLSIPKDWMETDLPLIVKSISETKEKFIEASKELHKINVNIKSNTNKTDPNDPYFSTLKEAMEEIQKDIVRFSEGNDEMDKIKLAKCNKNMNIIKRQYESYTTSASSSEMMNSLYLHQNQHEKIIENHITSMKLKIQDIIENYMIEIENKNAENVKILKFHLEGYFDIISEDEYEKIYKDKCKREIEKTQTTTSKTSKYGQIIL